MSAATYSALEDAIRAHIADEADAGHVLVADWYLLTAAVSDDPGATEYLHACSDSPMHTLLGLVTLAMRRLNALADDD